MKDFYSSSQQIFHEPVHPKYLPKERIIRYVPINTDVVVETSTKQFEELIKARYLDHLAFDSKATYERIKGLCSQTLEKEGCDKRPEWEGLRYRKEVLGGEVNDVIIKWIDNRFGFGLFANKRMEVGEFIGEYVGLVRPITYLFANVNHYCFRYPLYYIGYNVYTIDAQDMFNETSFINHCDHPNCESVVTLNNSLFHMCLITKRVVEKGEQLTYDYGNNLWKKLS